MRYERISLHQHGCLGCSTSTLRRWEAGGRLIPVRTEGGQRRYDLSTLQPQVQRDAKAFRKTIATHVGTELVFTLHQSRRVEVVIINHGEDTSSEEDLASDVLEIITVFSARLYGSRSHRNQKLIDGVRAAVKESQCS